MAAPPTPTNDWRQQLQRWLQPLRAAWAVLLNRQCPRCGEFNLDSLLCPACWAQLPYTHLRGAEGNVIERVFWSDHRVQRASAFLWYKPEFDIAPLVHAFKYHGRKDLAQSFGSAMAHELLATTFFHGVDALVPIPLSRRRQARRGYNQSQCLAEGVSQVTGLPIITEAIARAIDNPSQTTLAPTQRRDNVKDIFSLAQPELIDGKHILLIDDVITVGATIESLLRTLAPLTSLRISILALCAAGTYRVGHMTTADLRLPDRTAILRPDEVRKYRPKSNHEHPQ